MIKILFVGVAFAAFAAGSATAADMTPYPASAPAPVYSKTPMAQYYDWTGFYVGAHLGYGRATTDSTTIVTSTGALDAALSGRTSKLHEGGQAGFDYMMWSRVVIGVLADAATGDDTTTTLPNAAGTTLHSEESKTVVGGTVRGRLGFAFSNVLLYGTGGWAWTDATATRTQLVGKTGNAKPGTVEQVPANLSGWTAGAGLAFGFWRNWELFGEYRYTGYQSLTVVYPIAQRSTTSTTTTNSFTVGLNFKFNPFISRY